MRISDQSQPSGLDAVDSAGYLLRELEFKNQLQSAI